MKRLARDAFIRLVQLLRLEKQGLAVVVVYALGIGLASLAAPIGVQMLVSAIAFGGLVQPIAVLSLLVLVALIFAGALRAAQAWGVERIQQRLFVRVAADLTSRLPRTSLSALDEQHGPELVNRFFDVLTLQKGASMLLLDGVFVALQVLVGGVLLALYHPALLGFGAALLVALGIIMFGLGGSGTETSIKESKAKYALVGWLEEIARHPTLFRGSGGEKFAVARGEALTRSYVEYRQTHFKVVFRQTIAFLALQATSTAALLAIGGVLVLRGQLTLGQLVAAELIVTGVVGGFSKFGKYLETYYDLISAMDKLGNLVDLPLEREGAGVIRREGGPIGIRLFDVAYAYHHHRLGLARTTLDLPPGSKVAIVGPNGSGKSTLIDILYGLREPTRGHVEVNGLPLRDLSLRILRENIALVRGAAIFDGTILENIQMSRPSITLERVREALEAVGLWDEIASLPEGLDTHLTTDGDNLSSGHAQRLAIARAIAGRPGCLLLDEALDHLDPRSRRSILDAVLGPNVPWTAIVATHDPLVAEACSQAVRVEERVLTQPSSAGAES